ncbi:MAG: carbohydrate kinase, partial [Cyclobacteriaceae bacterium]|nr:carbohydrate kinase [Cyclobacteriaceae bacterium]
MKRERLLEIFDKIKKVNIAIYGDYCLDVYWMMAPEGSEISVETGLQAESVGRHYSSPAGAANILNNAAALQPKSIMPIGVVGNDMHGRELLRQLQELKVVTSSLAVQKEKFETNVFTKK